MKNINTNNDPDYQNYLERISNPPCPHKITEDELRQMKKQNKDSKKPPKRLGG